MIRTKWIWLMVAAVAALLFLGACEEDKKDGDGGPDPTSADGTPGDLQTDFGVTDTEIKLGMTLDKTTYRAATFAPIAPAMQALFEKVNQEDGGVCGREISLIVEDDQYAPAPSLERAGKLVEQDQILAFVGNLGTPAVNGHVEYVNDPNGDGDTSDGIPHLFLSTGAHKWGDVEQYPWTIGYIPDYVAEATVFATHLNENFAGQTAGILYQNDDFGQDGLTGFSDAFESDIVAEQSFEAGAPDIDSQLAILRAAEPDIILLYSLPLDTAKVFQYMQANSWDPQVVWSYVNPNTTMAGLAGGADKIAGVITTNYLLDPVADADAPALVEHARIMQTYDGGDPTLQLSIYGHSLADIVVETLQRACDSGDMTRAGVLAAAESIEGYRSAVLFEGIEINLSAEDHVALQSLVPVEIQADGTLKTLGETINVE